MPDQVTEVSLEQLRRVCDPNMFDFVSTQDLAPLDDVIGQERAVEAISFGIDIGSPGYHMYALGPAGTGKTTTIRQFLERTSADRPIPDDWCYVFNFDDADRPRALRLPAGSGRILEADMDRLADEMASEVPRAFESEEYRREKERIEDTFQKRRSALFGEFADEVDASGFALVPTPYGFLVAPVKKGAVISSEQLDQLDEATRRELERRQQDLQNRLRDIIHRAQILHKESRAQLRDLDRQTVGFAVNHLIDELKQKYTDIEMVVQFLDAVRADVLDNTPVVKEAHEEPGDSEQSLVSALAQGMQRSVFDRYRINLIVDNANTEGAPVIFESNPSYHNLIGRIEHQVQFTAFVTDFTMIKSGALHRANGGYLVLEARNVLLKPFAWDALKRALKDNDIKIEMMGEEYRMIATATLEPEPIPLEVKVLLVGEPLLYYLLFALDEDFQELFKVKADFGLQMDWTDETAHQYARFIGTLCREEHLRHFAPAGVARIIERSARMAAHQDKLATKFGDVVDLIREASYWAGRNGHAFVDADDVRRAIDHKVYRSNRLEERIREMIDEGTLLIDTQGAVIGQVNGISVLPLGDYAFGKPSRITARTHVGSEGVVSIDREAKLGGRIHTKGTMILAGYLAGIFAQEMPLALSASVTFEQLYEEVEGDSAASAELYALLSSLSGIPIRQELAVTGSVNQRGQVQAIGGVNEKIEGFFDVCRLKGFTGTQGVLIPASNVKHLMLREDVVRAIQEGQFHIYAVSTVDEGIAILTGVAAGERQPDGRYPDGTINGTVHRRLQVLVEKAKEFGQSASRHETLNSG